MSMIEYGVRCSDPETGDVIVYGAPSEEVARHMAENGLPTVCEGHEVVYRTVSEWGEAED